MWRGLAAFVLLYFVGCPCCSGYAPNTSRAGSKEYTVVLLYNKPPGVVTTHATDDPLGRPNVYDEVRSMKGYRGSATGASTFETVTGVKSSLHAIGRLDADTSGLILLTNDGRLVQHVSNKNALSIQEGKPISKTYEALVMGHHEPTSCILEEMRTRGVDIGSKYGGLTNPVNDIRVLAHPTPKTTLVSLVLVEGRNRQIRRMFHAVGSGVIRLRRTKIGSRLNLRGLEEDGSWRVLGREEVRQGLDWEPRQLEGPQHEQRHRKGRTRTTSRTRRRRLKQR